MISEKSVLKTALAVSVVVHGAGFFSLENAMTAAQRAMEIRVQKEKAASLQFEFVEAPPKAQPHKPVRTRRISDRDAVSQSLAKTRTSRIAQTKALGPSNQLAQRQNTGVQTPPVPPVASLPARQASAGESAKEAFLIPLPTKDTAQVAGLTSKDRITTQEMGKVKSPSAKFYGVTSFEATGSGMGEYMKNLKEKVWLAWFPYLAFRYPQDFKGADAVISFTLNARGQVKILKVVQSEGSGLFASYCMEAIQRASGSTSRGLGEPSDFGPVPKEILALLGKDEIELKFGFHYR